jgi:hypothetical protein
VSGTEERCTFTQVFIDTELTAINSGRNNSNCTVPTFPYDRRQERQEGE